jgi:hypothetical protein
MGGDPYQAIPSNDAASIFNRKVILAHVNTISIGHRSDVSTVVDDNEDSSAPRQLPQKPRPLDNIAIIQSLVSQLNRVHPSRDQLFGPIGELLDRRHAIDQSVKAYILQALAEPLRWLIGASAQDIRIVGFFVSRLSETTRHCCTCRFSGRFGARFALE